MKELIFYFSGTGNSKSVALLLAENNPDAEAVDITKTALKSFSAEKIGFVFPTYCYDLPSIFVAFIKNTEFVSEYFYAVTTIGGSAGNSLATVAELLKEKGHKLSYSASLLLPDSCIIFATPENTKKEWLASEKSKVDEISAAVQRGDVNVTRYSKLNRVITSISWWFMRKLLRGDKKKTNDNCSGCGLCAAKCPLDNISMVNGVPQFSDRCEMCFRCIHVCPNNAITFGAFKRNEKTRYIHHDVEL